MNDDTTKQHLRALAILSYLTMGVAAVLPIVARLEGKKPEMWAFGLLFAGAIGFATHRAVSSLSRRVSELEKQGRQT